MKITELEIKNFRSLKNVHMTNIPDIVVLAGPNGVGKSSVLEAILCLKETLGSYYGGWQKKGVVCVDAPFAEISIKFKMYPEESAYLGIVSGACPLTDELNGYIKIGKDGRQIESKCDQSLNTLLNLYDRLNYPDVGIFEYLYANRLLRNKDLFNVNLGGFSTDEEKSKRIFAQEKKFDQTKDYLAQLKLKDLQTVQRKILESTNALSKEEMPDSLKPIKAIFNTLFAPKNFSDVDLSVSPVMFLIQTPEGQIDIDDLSSGEKEILSVFTNLHKLKLNNSIILFDEPDLHLNQEIDKKIVNILKNLGKSNQFWITTHSFGIMNSVDYEELFRINHSNDDGQNQVIRVFDNQEKYLTFKSVTGDAGIVTLGEKVVFLEGIEYSDKFILETWFEQKKDKLTFVSSGSVNNVTKVNDKILNLLSTAARFNFFYAIRDRDFLTDEEKKELEKTNSRLYVWDKYHIENYLLDFEVIFEVLSNNFAKNPCSSPNDVKEKMKQTLITNKEYYLNEMVSYSLNKRIGILYFKVGYPNVKEKAVAKSEQIKTRVLKTLNKTEIEKVVDDNEDKLEKAIQSGSWVNLLPGRDLLKHFSVEHAKGLAYDQFKNQIMKEIMRQGRVDKEITDKVSSILASGE
jgi:predicted ATPase